MEKTVCGAMTRKGTLCQKAPLKNGRCRLHGGKSTGPKDRQKKSEQMKGNKHAVVTGAYETITYDTLLEQEKELLGHWRQNPLKRLESLKDESAIRHRRLMLRFLLEHQKENPDMDLVLKLHGALERADFKEIELDRYIRGLSAESENDNGAIGDLVDILSKHRRGL